MREVDTEDLLRKRRDVVEMAKRDERYQQLLRDKGVKLPEIDTNETAIESLESYARFMVEQSGLRWACYNSKDRAELICESPEPGFYGGAARSR